MKFITCILILLSLQISQAATIAVDLTENSTINVSIPKPVTCPEPKVCETCPPIPPQVVCPQMPQSEWTQCAKEGGKCEFTGTKLVRYGKGDKWIAKIVQGPVSCTNGTFTDPAIGLGKVCEVSSIPVEQPKVVSTPTPTPTPTPSPTPVTQGQLIITEANKIVRGVRVSNPSGECVIVKASGVQILDSEIGPCGRQGVLLQANNFTMQNTYVHDTAREGLYNYNNESIKIVGNRFENNSASLRFVESRKVLVEKNNAKNVLGDMKTPGAGMGNFVQFDKVRGAGNAIRCNVVENVEGQSKAEDVISVWASSGLIDAPIVVEYNRIKGGGPSHSSGGMLLGDGGGSHQVVRNNVCVNCGQYGLAVAGGQHNKVLDNKIFSVQKPWSNVGTYVWDQYNSSCSNITVTNNKINWVNKEGKQNAWWFTSTCGEVNKTGNTWGDASITASIFDQEIAECK